MTLLEKKRLNLVHPGGLTGSDIPYDGSQTLNQKIDAVDADATGLTNLDGGASDSVYGGIGGNGIDGGDSTSF